MKEIEHFNQIGLDVSEITWVQNSTGSIKELQDYLDKWCDNCGVGDTYYENHKYKVRIPWEEYDDYQ